MTSLKGLLSFRPFQVTAGWGLNLTYFPRQPLVWRAKHLPVGILELTKERTVMFYCSLEAAGSPPNWWEMAESLFLEVFEALFINAVFLGNLLRFLKIELALLQPRKGTCHSVCVSLSFSFLFQPHKHAWQGSCLDGIARFRGLACGFLQTELNTIMPSRKIIRIWISPPSPKLLEHGEMFSALAASLQCISALMVLMKVWNHPTAFILLKWDGLKWR